MASDSEGLRPLHCRSNSVPSYTLKMASDSEGLRLYSIFSSIDFLGVENGFRFGRVTTRNLLCNLLLANSFWLKMASDSEGLRLRKEEEDSNLLIS